MQFNPHFALAGKHAYLSASKYHWINYDEEKMARTFTTALAAMKGTQLHDLAAQLIKMRIPLPRNSKTINAYVNDAIGYKMEPEQMLFYSENSFGTADAISFRKNMLRIHDLKTGITRSSVHQLEIYAALFCLEYEFKPFEIEMEFRIYQNDDVQIYEGNPDDITHIMSKIISFDKIIKRMKEEALG